MFNRKFFLPLLAIVLALVSLVFIQQQVFAQWTPPPSNPGEGNINTPLTNPLQVNLNFQDTSGVKHSIINAQDATFAGTVQSNFLRGTNLCIGADCKTTWPTGDVKNPMDKDLNAGGFGITNIKGVDTDKVGIWAGLEVIAGLNKVDSNPSINTAGLYAQTRADSDSGFSYGVYGLSNNTGGFGIFGAASSGWAGYFVGPVGVDGIFSVEDQICLQGNCINSWPAGGSSQWIDDINGIHYNTGNVGINKTNATARLQVNAPVNTEGLRIVTAAGWSPFNIRNNADVADIFRVDQNGSLAVGTVPWARLGSYPAACSGGQFVTGVGGTLTCATPAGGSQWTTNGANIYFNGGNVGIGNVPVPDAPLTFPGTTGQKIHLYGLVGNSYVIGVESNELRIASGSGGSDVVAFRTGGYAGTERMRITPSGVGIGDASPASTLTVGNGDLFQVNSTGNLVRVNNVAYSWPAAQGAASTYLMNNGSGTLTWSTPAGGVGGSGTTNYMTRWVNGTTVGASSLLYDNGTSLGLGTATPNAASEMQINAGANNEALRLVTNAAWSPFNIRNSGDTADIFRVDQTGSLAAGTVPWARLGSYPAACPAGQYVTAVGGTLTCATPAGASLPAGTTGQTMRYDGANWVANSLLYNNGTSIGIGTVSPTTQLHLHNPAGGSNLSLQGNVVDAEKWEIYQAAGAGNALVFRKDGAARFWVYGSDGLNTDNTAYANIFRTNDYIVAGPSLLDQGGDVNNRVIVDGDVVVYGAGGLSRGVKSAYGLYNIIDTENTGNKVFNIFKVNTNTSNKLFELDSSGGFLMGFDGSSWALQGTGGNILSRRNIGIGGNLFTPSSALHVADGYYAQFQDNNAGAPLGTDCDSAGELGRISIGTTNNRLYVCMGATRGWDYVNLTDL